MTDLHNQYRLLYYLYEDNNKGLVSRIIIITSIILHNFNCVGDQIKSCSGDLIYLRFGIDI